MNTATRNKRGVLADEHAFNGDYSNNNDEAANAFKSFKEGFDAAYVIARKEAEVLVQAIQRVTDNRAGGCVYVDKMKILKEALKTYEQGQADE